MNGMNGLNMKLEKDQKLTGKMFTMTSTLGKVTTPAKAAPTASTSKDSDGKSKVNHFVSSIPCMPCVHQDLEHREKFGQTDVRFGKLFNAMVSRPVGRKEMMEDPDAKASMRNEWLGQHKQGVYDFSIVREYDEVVAEANEKEKKSTWHEFTAFVSRRTISYQRGALDVSSKEEAFYLEIK